MKIKQYLKEVTVGIVKDAGAYIYKFPLTNDERKDLDNGYQIRFAAYSDTKEVYVFSAFSLIHNDVDKYLHKTSYSDATLHPEKIKSPALFGTTDQHFNFMTSDLLKGKRYVVGNTKTYAEKVSNTDWSFAYKYINGLDVFLKKFRATMQQDKTKNRKI